MKLIKEVGRNAYIDWIFIFCMTVVIFVALAIASFSLYNAVVRGDYKGNDSESRISSLRFDQKVFTSVMERFTMREAATTRVRAGYTGVSDPSF